MTTGMSTPPPNAGTEAALLVLTGAAKEKRNWSEVADALLVLEASSALDENGLP